MKTRLHILFLNSWYPSRVLPNNGDFIQRHAESVALKHKVTAVNIISDSKIKTNFQITDTNINGVRTLIGYLQPNKNPIIKTIRYFKVFKKIIEKLDSIDVVHLNVTYPFGLFALYLKHKKKLSYIISEHWTDYQYPLNKQIGWLKKIITKYIIKQAFTVCPVSRHLKKAMTDFNLNGNYHPIPNVVDTSIFKPGKLNAKEFVITHISNMNNDHKNVKGLLNAIKNLDQNSLKFKLRLIGENSNQYKSYTQKLSLNNVDFIDQIPHKKVADYLKSSDVFVLFSNYENLPCVILEAFACGVPVISTDVGGISEYFPKDFGYLIKPKDESALTKAILNIYRQKESFDKNKMHQYADQHFGMKTIAESFSDLYFKALNQKTN